MGSQEEVVLKFAERLKVLCREKGIAPQDLELSDTDRDMLKGILEGTVENIDLLTVVRVAEALDVQPYILFIPQR